MPSEPSAAASDTIINRCDVCIVGAGIAGMNALFVASRYLSQDQKVVLVDSRPRVGGMWVDTYPYVRLHQPHPMFTAGDIEWSLGADRSYLATKGEVLDHFTHPTAEAENYFAGLMSEAEKKTIAEGVHNVVMDYFDDVVDRNGSTELVFRSGSTRTIQPGSWIVNCTGYWDATAVCCMSHTFPHAGR